MEYANFGFSSNDGQRTWQADRRAGQSVPVAEWRQDDPGIMPAGDVYGGGSPTGIVFYENGALGAVLGRDLLRRGRGPERGVRLQAGPRGRRLRPRSQGLPDLQREAAVRRVGFRRRQRPPPRERSRRCSGRRTSPSGPTARSTSATGSTRASAATRISTTRCRAPSTGSRRRASCRRCRRSMPATIDGLITALRSPAVNVRAIGFDRAQGAGRVGRGRRGGAAERSKSLHAGPRDLPPLSARARRPCSAPASAGVVRRIPALRIAAYRAMRRAGLDVLPAAATARARRRSRRPPRSRASRCATSRRRQVARHPRRHSPRLRRPGPQLSRSARHRRHRQRGGALRPAPYRDGSRDRSAQLVAGLHVDRLAAARAGVGRGRVGAGAVVEALARRSPLRPRHPGLHRRPGGVEGHAWLRAARQRRSGNRPRCGC